MSVGFTIPGQQDGTLQPKTVQEWSQSIVLPDVIQQSHDPEDQTIRELAAEANRLHHIIITNKFPGKPEKQAEISVKRSRILEKLSKAIAEKRKQKGTIDISRLLGWMLDHVIEVLAKNQLPSDQVQVIISQIAKSIESQNLEERSLQRALSVGE